MKPKYYVYLFLFLLFHACAVGVIYLTKETIEFSNKETVINRNLAVKYLDESYEYEQKQYTQVLKKLERKRKFNQIDSLSYVELKNYVIEEQDSSFKMYISKREKLINTQ